MADQPIKTIYYRDLLNDDFANNGISQAHLPKNYKYIWKNPFARAAEWLVYYLVGRPLTWLAGKLVWGVKVMGKRNLRHLGKTAVFYYGNHTQIADAWTIQTSTHRHSYIIANQDATSIKGMKTLVHMFGCLPVPMTHEENQKFVDAIHYHVGKNHGIVIFPEAHIWPFYTHIRPFSDASFTYPAEAGAPVVPFVTTYRKRKVFKNKSPRMTVHIGRPIYPNMSLSLAERKKALRDAVYEFMIEKSGDEENVEWIRYLPASEEPEGEKQPEAKAE